MQRLLQDPHIARIADEVETLTIEAEPSSTEPTRRPIGLPVRPAAAMMRSTAWRKRGSSKSPGQPSEAVRSTWPTHSPSTPRHVGDRVDILDPKRRLDLGEVDDLGVGLRHQIRHRARVLVVRHSQRHRPLPHRRIARAGEVLSTSSTVSTIGDMIDRRPCRAPATPDRDPSTAGRRWPAGRPPRDSATRSSRGRA